MYLPKPEVYAALSTIADVMVLQGSQKTIVDVPAITFYLSDDNEVVNLNNETVKQDVQFNVDIWAKNSTEADALLSQVHSKMKGLGYRRTFTMDVPDPQNICHINTRFDGIKTN